MSEYFTKKDAKELKEDIKQIVEENRKEMQRHVSIVSEDFQHKLGFVIDELRAVEKRLNAKIESEVKDLRVEIREVRQELISHRDNTEAHVQKAKKEMVS